MLTRQLGSGRRLVSPTACHYSPGTPSTALGQNDHTGSLLSVVLGPMHATRSGVTLVLPGWRG